MGVTTNPVLDTLNSHNIKFVDVDGIRTRYYESGQGESLILFHGGQFGGLYSLDCWSLNLPGLSEKFHVLAVDKLGQGYTDNPKSAQHYTFEALFRHAEGFLETLGVTKAHLVGHSRGGLLVAKLALEHPDIVSSVVIVDSNTTAADSPIFPAGKFYQNLPIPPGPPTRQTIRVEPDHQSFSIDHITDQFITRMLDIALLPKFQEAERCIKENNLSVWTPSLNRHKWEVLNTIDESGLMVPTLIVWGVNDPSAPLPLAYQIYERIALKTPIAELNIINNAGHYCFREHPGTFNRIVRGFCSS